MRSIDHSNLKPIQAKEKDKVGIFMIHLIMTIKISTDQIVEIKEFSLADKEEVNQGRNKTTREEFLGATQGHIKILEGK